MYERFKYFISSTYICRFKKSNPIDWTFLLPINQYLNESKLLKLSTLIDFAF